MKTLQVLGAFWDNVGSESGSLAFFHIAKEDKVQ